MIKQLTGLLTAQRSLNWPILTESFLLTSSELRVVLSTIEVNEASNKFNELLSGWLALGLMHRALGKEVKQSSGYVSIATQFGLGGIKRYWKNCEQEEKDKKVKKTLNRVVNFLEHAERGEGLWDLLYRYSWRETVDSQRLISDRQKMWLMLADSIKSSESEEGFCDKLIRNTSEEVIYKNKISEDDIRLMIQINQVKIGFGKALNDLIKVIVEQKSVSELNEKLLVLKKIKVDKTIGSFDYWVQRVWDPLKNYLPNQDVHELVLLLLTSQGAWGNGISRQINRGSSILQMQDQDQWKGEYVKAAVRIRAEKLNFLLKDLGGKSYSSFDSLNAILKQLHKQVEDLESNYKDLLNQCNDDFLMMISKDNQELIKKVSGVVKKYEHTVLKWQDVKDIKTHKHAAYNIPYRQWDQEQLGVFIEDVWGRKIRKRNDLPPMSYKISQKINEALSLLYDRPQIEQGSVFGKLLDTFVDKTPKNLWEDQILEHEKNIYGITGLNDFLCSKTGFALDNESSLKTNIESIKEIGAYLNGNESKIVSPLSMEVLTVLLGKLTSEERTLVLEKVLTRRLDNVFEYLSTVEGKAVIKGLADNEWHWQAKFERFLKSQGLLSFIGFLRKTELKDKNQYCYQFKCLFDLDNQQVSDLQSLFKEKLKLWPSEATNYFKVYLANTQGLDWIGLTEQEGWSSSQKEYLDRLGENELTELVANQLLLLKKYIKDKIGNDLWIDYPRFKEYVEVLSKSKNTENYNEGLKECLLFLKNYNHAFVKSRPTVKIKDLPESFQKSYSVEKKLNNKKIKP